jgi:hydrogenase-4 component E
VHQFVEALLILVMLVNLFVLGTSRVRAVIHGSAIQGALLGALILALHHGVRGVAFGLAAIAIKAVVIPGLLHRAMREVVIRREVEPFIGFGTSLVLGAVATALALLFSMGLPLAPEHRGSLLVPAAIATVLTGFLVLTTRRKAITQVVGYLVLENGVFVMGLTLVDAMPFFVELGVLLDLVVAIFVLGIMIHHINRQFSSLDTTHLSRLRE